MNLRRPTAHLLGLPLLLVLVLLGSSGCSGQDCAPDASGLGPSSADPFAGWQDIQLSAEVIEVADAEWMSTHTVDIVISNVGGNDLEIGSSELDSWSSPQWSFDPATVPAELAVGQSATVQAHFDNSVAGDSYAAISFYSNDPQQERAAVGLIGRSTRVVPAARLSPPVLDFGFQFPGGQATGELEVTNEGEAPFSLGEASIEQVPGGNYTLLTPAFAIQNTVIDPGESFAVEINFAPEGTLPENAVFSVTTDDPQRPELSADLRANNSGALGCTAPTISMSSPAAPFELALDQGNVLEIAASVGDNEQPAEGLLIELLLGDTLIEDEFSGPDGAVLFNIFLDDYEVDNVWPAFPTGINTFRLRVTDACPRSSELRFVAAFGAELPTSGDHDGDGYSLAGGDCDGNDSGTYPGAVELQDGLDNDCDGSIDNGTASWDNDCDGYCASPPCLGQGPASHSSDSCEGLASDSDSLADCDDRTSDSNQDGLSDGADYSPALVELPDFRDQDCDGSVDEGTGFADDDNDGLTEFDGDCDDQSADTYPLALELCDQADNDCDGIVDEDCIEAVLAPQIVGDILTNLYEVAFETEVEARIVVLSDAEELTYSWEADIGTITTDPSGTSILWQAPAATSDNLDLQGTFANLYVTVTDDRGRSTSAFGLIRLASDADGPTYSSVGGESCGCSLGSPEQDRPMLLLLLLTLALMPLSRSGRRA